MQTEQKGEVWVLEDSVLEARLTTEALGSKCSVTVFPEGTSLIERLATHVPEVLVLDWVLPGLSGLEVSRFVRETFNKLELPILMLTANTSEESLLEGLAAGANDFVAKPFRGMELLARVETLLGVSRLSRAATAREAQTVSDLKQEMAALVDAAEAERLRKDKYLGIVGHDLRNPLNAIVMATMLLENASGDTTRYVERIRRSANRMALMIRDILDFSRGRLLDGLPVSPSRVDLGRLCEDVVEELTIANAGREIEFQSSGDLVGLWDPDRLQQAISNLVGNALEHSTGPVTLAVRTDKDTALIEVHNGGPGITAAEIPVLFEPFRRRDARVGLGLGLYIVKEVARAHRGTVAVTSVANERTTFRMTLPRGAV